MSGRALLSLEDYDNVSISFGTKSKYPSFDLVITEKANRRNQSYWCEVDTPKYNSKSLHWTPFGPFVLFTSTLIYPGEGLPEERGTCTVEGFAQHSSLEYQVQFYSNLGPKTDENLLGHYLIRRKCFKAHSF